MMFIAYIYGEIIVRVIWKPWSGTVIITFSVDSPQIFRKGNVNLTCNITRKENYIESKIPISVLRNSWAIRIE
jgi:hypothetical protein